MTIIFIIITTIILSSCENSSKNEIHNLMGSPINFPLNGIISQMGCDTSIVNYYNSKYKLVHYLDSANCQSCVAKNLFVWDELIEYSKDPNNNLKLYFIFTSKDMKSLMVNIIGNNFDHPILIDSIGEFERLNPHLPKNTMLHTFLLDENIIDIGSVNYLKDR